MSSELTYVSPPTSPARVAEDADTVAAAAEPARPSGPAAAAVLAAGLAAFALGALSVLTAASTTVSDALTLSDRVGDLSGVTTAVSLVFFAAWIVFATRWRRADPPLGRIAIASALLIGLGLLGTFPPFFNAFGG